MCKLWETIKSWEWETIKSWESQKTHWEYFWSNEWMVRIARLIDETNSDPNLPYDEKENRIKAYKKAMSSVNPI